MSEPDIDPDEAGCRLILVSPGTLVPETFAATLDQTLAAGRPAAFVLDPAEADALPAAAAVLAPICRTREVAFLVRADARTAVDLGADGALVGEPDVKAARALLGQDRILGVACGLSRHGAMVAGEDGADYLMFGNLDRPPGPEAVEMAAWWRELFVLPVAIAGRIEATDAGELARSADFLAVRDVVWQHPQGPAHAVASLEEALGRAR